MKAEIELLSSLKPVSESDWEGCDLCNRINVMRIFRINVESLPVEIYKQLLLSKPQEFIDKCRAINNNFGVSFKDLSTDTKFIGTYSFTICGECCWLFVMAYYHHAYDKFEKLYDSHLPEKVEQ